MTVMLAMGLAESIGVLNIFGGTEMVRNLIVYRLILGVAFVGSVLASMQAADAATIQIRVLNAKNGKRVTNQKVSVDIKGEKGATEYVTDAEGEFSLEIDSSAEIWVGTEWWVTCHTVNPMTPHYFSVDKIIKEGVTEENNCGHAKSEPIRGKMIIFARKASLAELFAK
jgi:hypothetical protein